MTNTTTKKGAVKGTVAAAAGVAVLLGGAGTFALWNAEGSIGTTGTRTGEMTAEISDMTWVDQATNGTVTPDSFKMVPGDVLVGTATMTVDAAGDNLKVEPKLEGLESQSLLGGDVTVATKLTKDDQPVGTLVEGKDQELVATVTITFNEESTASMNQDIDLEGVSFVLQQVSPNA